MTSRHVRDHVRIVRSEICAGRERSRIGCLCDSFIGFSSVCASCRAFVRSAPCLCDFIPLPVKPASPPTIQSVLLLHVFLHVEENALA